MPMFQRRHYEAIAALLKAHPHMAVAPWADMLSEDNPRFDRDRFYRAVLWGQRLNKPAPVEQDRWADDGGPVRDFA